MSSSFTTAARKQANLFPHLSLSLSQFNLHIDEAQKPFEASKKKEKKYI